MIMLTNAFNQNVLDRIMPPFGTKRMNIPVWDEGQKMFICGEYESATGHLYYRGVRFCERIVISEKVGLYHNWTYIDAIELYVFNGTRLELVQTRVYEKTFRDEATIRRDSEEMVKNYLNGVIKSQGLNMPSRQIEAQARELVEGCYKSFLDADYNNRLMQILPAIEQK